MKCKHPGWSDWTYGNGLFRYTPKLTADYSDFDAGAYSHHGVRQTSRGLETADGGQATFKLRTPYIIVGQVREMGPPVRIEGAATVSYHALGPLRLSVSTDNGLTWNVADHARSDRGRTVDLTPHALSTYGYLIRFDFEGQSGLSDLTMDTWTQLAPVSLPRLFRGENPLHFALGDRYGHPTSVKEIRLNLRDPAQLERHMIRLDGEYRPLRHTSRITGDLVLKTDAKPGAGIKWFTAGGYFRTHLGAAALRNRNAIAYAVDGPDGPWHEVYRSDDVPSWVQHWHYGADRDVVLDDPKETVYLKYTGDPGLNQVWIYAHCLGADQPSRAKIRVTHGYEIEGKMQEDTFEFSQDADYTITCPSEPVNRFIRFAVDNQMRE